MQKILLPLIILLSSLLISSCETYTEELESLEGSYFNKVSLEKLNPVVKEGQKNIVFEIVFDMHNVSVNEIDIYLDLNDRNLDISDYIEKIELVNMEGTMNDFFPDDLDFDGENLSIEFSSVVAHFKPKRFSRYQLVITTKENFPKEITAYSNISGILYRYDSYGYYHNFWTEVENELKNVQFVKN